MSVSRRAFVRSLTSGGPSAAAIAARGREAWVGEYGPLAEQSAPAARPRDAVRLNSNESPLGPSAPARQAIEHAFAFAGRYPMNAKPAMADFRTLIANRNQLKIENVLLGAGSGEILDSAVRAFTTRQHGLVAGLPTFESPARTARQIEVPVTEILVDDAGRLDLEKMIGASTGAGLVFVCNPNNPTGTVHPAKAIADLVTRIRKASPDTAILIDEAYHEYVTDSAYATAIPLVSEHPNVIISRTMSKAHGMAGLRLGYAVGQAEAIARLAPWMMPYNANAPVVGASVASIEDEPGIVREQRRNTEARKFTADFFNNAGMKTSDSQANFVWVNLGRPAKDFREACEKQGILVGRDFEPFEKTHCRISIGTMEEMEKAVSVFRSVLGLTTTSAAR
jgi:histidinol-phosphate aminotransferase